jgi:HSP20 family protein
MKLAFLTATMLPILVSGYQMGGFDMFGRPVMILRGGRRTGAGYCSPSEQQQEYYRRQQQLRNQDVEQAFKNLQNDLQPPSKEAIAKQKELVDRTFGFLSELNRDVAVSEEQVKKNEDAIRKQQKWVNKVIDFATDLNQDVFSTTKDESSQQQKVENGNESGFNDRMTPRSSIKDNDTAFQVELELPGVESSDIGIDVKEKKERKVLVVSGKRKDLGSDRADSFSKSFELPESVDTDKISAKLSNGILVIFAPKEVKKEKEQVKRIPVMPGN